MRLLLRLGSEAGQESSIYVSIIVMNLLSFIKNLKVKRKVIFLAAGALLLGELVWALPTISAFLSPPKAPPVPVVSTKQQSSLFATAKLETDRKTIKVGEKFTVKINILTVKPTDGTDIIVSYDPGLLSVVNDEKGLPVTVGFVYTDYPFNSVEESSGRIAVSGISSKENGVVPNGLFGSIVFLAKDAGTAKIDFDFTPGSTIDSNVIELKTGKDILNQVENLQVTIAP